MRSIYPFFLLVFSVFSGFSSPVSVVNDSPCSADDMGILDTATACPFSSGGTPLTRFNQSNVSATAELLEASLMNCQGLNVDMPVQSKDMWYKFIVKAHTLNVIVTGGISTPFVALYQYTGDCMTMVPVDCAKGSGGYLNADFAALLPGAQYYLQVTGSSLSDAGTFNLVVSNSQNCLSCTQDAVLFVDRPPVNGFYNLGDTVNFCYVVNGYKRHNNNSLHGVVPVFGPGWNSNVTFFPVTRTSTAPGVWRQGYTYPNLPVIGTQKGFFFDDPSLDGPQNNLGDPGGISDHWIFCWQAVANTNCLPSQNLNITVHDFSDGETGTGPHPGCIADNKFHFASKLNCCGSMQEHQTTASCATICNASAIVQITPNVTSFPPLYIYGWFNPSGSLVNTIFPVVPQYADTLTGMCEGDYSVVVTNTSQNCFLAKSVEIKTAFTLDIQQTTFACQPSNFISATVTALPNTNNYLYSWSSGSTNATATNLFAGQTYVVYVTANGCTLTDTIKPHILPYSDPFFQYPSQYISKCTGGALFVDPLFIANPGGTFFCNTPGVVDTVTGQISVSNTVVNNSYQIIYTSPGPCPGTYVVTITIVGQDRAYFHYPATTVCSSKYDNLVPDSVAAYGGTFSCVPSGLFVDSLSGIIYPPFTPGTYHIKYSSPNPGICHDTFSVVITVRPPPAAPQEPSGGYFYCPGDPTITMTVTQNPPCNSCIITWFSDAQFTNLVGTGPTITVNTNQAPLTFYYLAALDQTTGCVSSPSIISVTMASNPTVAISSSDSVVCPGFTGYLHSALNSTSYSYSWVPSNNLNNGSIPDPQYNLSATTTFTLFVTDNTSGCSAYDIFTVVVDSSLNCHQLHFYSGITPNGDNHNDVWIIDGINLFPNNRVLIFTRWGEKVWEASNYNNRDVVWDGKNLLGRPLVAGTYFYVVEIPGQDSQKGWVELSR